MSKNECREPARIRRIMNSCTNEKALRNELYMEWNQARGDYLPYGFDEDVMPLAEAVLLGHLCSHDHDVAPYLKFWKDKGGEKNILFQRLEEERQRVEHIESVAGAYVMSAALWGDNTRLLALVEKTKKSLKEIERLEAELENL